MRAAQLKLLRPLAWFLFAAVATISADRAFKEIAARRLATSGPGGPNHYLVVTTPDDTWVPTRTALGDEFTLSSSAELDRIARHHVRILGGRTPHPDELLPPGTHLQILNRDITVVDGVLTLRYLENRRASFALPTERIGLGPQELGVIGLLIFFACLALLYIAPRDRAEFSIGLGLVAGGTVGNAYDRLVYGAVIDYVSIPDLQTFNFADVAIGLGGILMLFQLALWLVWERFHPIGGGADELPPQGLDHSRST